MAQPSRVRCYECGRRTGPDLASCSQCGAVQFSLCECEGPLSVYDTSCDRCGREQTPRRYVARFRRLRLLIVLGVVLLLGVLAWRLIPRDQATMKRRAFDSAVSDFDAGRYDLTRLKLERFISDHGETPRALYLLGASLFRLGHVEEARGKAERALELEPDLDEASLFLSSLAYSEGEYGRALEFARRALAAPPRPPAAYVLLGKVFTRPEHLNIGAAIHQLEAAVDAGSEDPEAFILLAELILRTRRVVPARYFAADAARHVERAREIAKDLLAENRDDPEIRFFLARCDYATGDLESAYVHLRKALIHKELPEPLRLLLAKIEWRQENRAEARRLFDELTAGATDVGLLLEISDFFEERGRTDLSGRVLAEARDKFGQSVGVVLRSAAALARAGKRDEALGAVNRAILRAPDDYRLAALRADVLRAAGRPDEAERGLRGALIRAPEDELLRMSLADLLLDPPARRDRIAEAATLVGGIETPVWKGSPYSFYLAFLRGKLLLRERRHGEALEALREVEAQLPDHFGTRILLAELHRVRGERDLEMDELDAAIRIRGKLPGILVARAEAGLARGRFDSAERDARAALEASPASEAARIVLARTLVERPRPRFEDAESLLRLAIAEPGASVLPRIALGRLLADRGEASGGEEVLLAALRGAASEDFGLAAAAALADLRASGPEERVELVWKEFLNAHPESVGGHLVYAAALLDKGATGEARLLLERALLLDPGSIRVRRYLFDAALLPPEGGLPDMSGAERTAGEIHSLAPDGPEDLYVRGRLALHRDDLPEAERLLALAFDRAPTDARIAQHLGFALYLQKEHDRAAEVLERAVTIEPALLSARTLLARARFERGRVLLDSGLDLDAAEALESALRLEPDLLPAQALLALAMFRTGSDADPAALTRAAEECVSLIGGLEAKGEAITDGEVEGMLLPGYVLLADISRQRGDLDGLRRGLEGYLRLRPRDAAVALNLAAAYLEAGEPQKVEALLEVAAASPLRFHVLARAREDLGNPAGALAALEDWTREYPEDAIAREALGRFHAREDRPGAAIRELSAALDLDPGRVGAAEVLLDLLASSRGTAAAIAAVEPYLEKSPRAPELKALLVETALDGDPDAAGAAEDLEAALREKFLSPHYRVRATIILLRLCLRDGRLETGARAALEFLRFANSTLDAPPGTPLARSAAEALFLCGLVHHLAKDRVAAEHGYRKAIHLDPTHLAAMNNLAELLLETPDRARDALEEAERASELAPGRPEVHDTLGKARLAVADAPGALRAFDRAVRLYRDAIEDPPESWDPRTVSALLAEALVGRALARVSTGDSPGARADLDEAVKVDPRAAETVRYRTARSQLPD